MLIRRSVPEGPPISLLEAKEELNVFHTDDDFKITRLIQSEVAKYEAFSGRIMAPTDFELRLDAFCDPVDIPAAPVREVTEVAYLDADDAEQSVPSSDWYVAREAGGWQVRWVEGFTAPDLSSRKGAVMIRFSAGYDLPGAASSPVDAELVRNERDVTNILMMVAPLYDGEPEVTFAQMRDRMGSRRILK